MKNQKTLLSTHNMVKIAILSAISVLIMLLEFPLPFAPTFYELDLSEAVILMGGFDMGPLSAVIMELLKNLLNLLINGTITAGVGEFANFVMGCALVVPASIIYKYRKTFKGALTGLIVGTVSLGVIGCFVNYFVMIPAYVKLANFPLDAIIGAAGERNAAVDSLWKMIIFAVAPFNLIKGVACSILNLLLYKRLSRILHI